MHQAPATRGCQCKGGVPGNRTPTELLGNATTAYHCEREQPPHDSQMERVAVPTQLPLWRGSPFQLQLGHQADCHKHTTQQFSTDACFLKSTFILYSLFFTPGD